eukprot:gnl/TRDRNA2_/TRDRNA2_68681_c0_seq2.p1 gnl/TRDRNA2_/TRDRNA2_68681_c0~~gnl/TRDRNA2_/TRDRNA2_68681_c0_seq2.p1  ORF type:complete len:273 (-),score=43.84 gnl/TRDRNA2_/TRDRNA2_68681_c0_seq2:66-884(-)
MAKDDTPADDPFLVNGSAAKRPPLPRPVAGTNGGGWREPSDEKKPLLGGAAPTTETLTVRGAVCCQLVFAAISASALILAWPEAGHRESVWRHSPYHQGCEKVLHWMVATVIMDACGICILCIAGTAKEENKLMHVGMSFGRLAIFVAGIIIVYFSGVKHSICDPFLMTWAQIILWLNIVILLLSCCCLAMMIGVGAGAALGTHMFKTKNETDAKQQAKVRQHQYDSGNPQSGVNPQNGGQHRNGNPQSGGGQQRSLSNPQSGGSSDDAAAV